ncbi:hypothetical protein [Herbidospora sp. RD11066]
MRLWSVLVPLAAVLLTVAPPAQAAAAEPTISVTAVGAEPPSYTGQCYPGKQFTLTATITADGPGTVSYTWSHEYRPTYRSVTFTEAGTQTVTVTRTSYFGNAPQQSTLSARGANQAETTIEYGLNCTDPVPSEPTIQPATDYIGRCGSDVVHTINARISSPIAQTVRYRWKSYGDRPLPGLGDQREVVFTEPGTKTVSAPFQRVPIEGTNAGWTVEVEIVSPGSATQDSLYYRTVCVKAELTSLTRVTGSCKPATPYKFKVDGVIESNAIGQMSYVWARQMEAGGDWVRDTPTPIAFYNSTSPGSQTVSKTFLAAMGESGAVRLEIIGTDGDVVSTSRTYKTCNVDI